MDKLLALIVWLCLAVSVNGQALVVSGPVNGPGNLLSTWATQAPNTVFVGPTSGGNASPAFRLLAIGDIPDLSSLYLSVGGQTITLVGDVTGTGTALITTTIGAGKVTNAMLAGSVAASKLVGTDIATVGTITSGTWQGTVIGSSFGGAGTVNGLLKANGSGVVSLAVAGTDYLTGNQTITLSGDLSGSGSTSISATIGSDAVTFAKMQNVATATILGRTTAGTGDPEALTGTQATALLDVLGSAVKGLAPASGGGTTNFLRADGTWASPPGSGSGDNITINGSAVTDANFNGTTPAAVSGSANVTWQTSGSGPGQVAAYIDLGNLAAPLIHKPGYYSEFLSTNAVQGILIGAAVSSGTNTTAPASGVITGDHPGVILARSSTTANSGYRYQTDAAQIRIGGGEVFDIVFRTPAALTNTTYRFGLLDTTTSADAVDGAYFEIPSTGAAVGKTSNNSTRSTTATIATLSTNTWYHARIVVNSAASQVDFTIYSEAGSSLGTANLTANIPTAAGRETGAGFIGTNSGTTASDVVNLDYMAITFTRSLQRGLGN